jgi:hypothetical protein
MSFLVCHFEKYKSANVFGIQKHNQRENENYSNKDVDKARTPLNYDLINQGNINYLKKIKTLIEANRASQRAIRKDAVVYCECVISSDKGFFEDLSLIKQKAFFEESLNYIKSKVGENNIISATVHLDETTPHMHLGFVPLIENSLSAKKLINRQFLKEVQDQLPNVLKNKGFNIERGTEGSKVKHKETKEFKVELEKDVKRLEKQLNDLTNKINEKTLEFDKMTKILDENSLVMYQIEEMKSEPVMFSNKVKINKDDFEKLKDSALKAYSQHSLYATVLEQLERLKRDKERYRNELKESEKNRKHEYIKLKSELDKLKESNKEIIDKKEFENTMLRFSISKRDRFIEKVGLEKELDKFIESENKKVFEKIELNIGLKKSKNKSNFFDLEI